MKKLNNNVHFKCKGISDKTISGNVQSEGLVNDVYKNNRKGQHNCYKQERYK